MTEHDKNSSGLLFESGDFVFKTEVKPKVTPDENTESAFPPIETDNLSNENESDDLSSAVSEDDSVGDETEINESSVVNEEIEVEEFHYVEPKNPFASGLPSWTLEPPGLPVIKKNRL